MGVAILDSSYVVNKTMSLKWDAEFLESVGHLL